MYSLQVISKLFCCALLLTLLGALPAAALTPLPGVFIPVGNTDSTSGVIGLARLPSGQVLVVSSFTAQIFDPSTRSWGASIGMLGAHQAGMVTSLPDGRVLVTGTASTSSTVSAEIYSPDINTFSVVGPMNVVRYNAKAVALPNGEVLIAGGYRPVMGGPSPTIPDAEIFSPTTNLFRATGSMAIGRDAFTATVLNDGKVLVAGGFSASGPQDTAEIYDPATGLFNGTGKLVNNRQQHAAALMDDGRVLLNGGWWLYGGSSYRASHSTEIYTPATGTFASTVTQWVDRFDHFMLKLPNGSVLMCGGQDDWGAFNRWVSFYDPALVTFTTVSDSSINVGRSRASTLDLGNGEFIVAGGNGAGGVTLNSVEMFVPDTLLETGFE